MPREWKVRLSEAAQRDFDEIFLWTIERFGIDRARPCRCVILDALQALHDGSDILGAGDHSGLPRRIKTLHVARSGKRGQNFIVFDSVTKGKCPAKMALRMIRQG